MSDRLSRVFVSRVLVSRVLVSRVCRLAALLTVPITFTIATSSCAGEDNADEPSAMTSAAQTDPNDPSWDCYAPEPGHPSPAEKQQFFTRNAPAAQEAERTYGVPAAAILAMAAQEGGYGFTRIAKYANNTFGYKFTSTSSAGGRGSYTLTCQPDWDVGNRYIAFSSLRDAILFISYKLANRADYANYKAATDRYRSRRAAGGDIATAVNEWIDGIADAGYNYDPPTYKRTLKALLASASLYAYSASVSVRGTGTTAPSSSSSPSSPSSPSTPSSPPSWISIDAPASDAYVSGDVALGSSVPSNVTAVRFVSITTSGSEYTIATKYGPFTATWATAGSVPNGTYTLRYEAWNGPTKLAQASRRVHVAN